MKKILLLVALATVLSADIVPIKPIAPIGYDSDDAVVMNDGSGSKWVFIKR